MHKHNKTQNCKNPKVQYFKKHWHAKNQKHKNTKNTKDAKITKHKKHEHVQKCKNAKTQGNIKQLNYITKVEICTVHENAKTKTNTRTQ